MLNETFLTPVLYKHGKRVELLERMLNSKPTEQWMDVPAPGKKVAVRPITTELFSEDLKDMINACRWANEEWFGYEVFERLPITMNLNTYGVGDEYAMHVDFKPKGSPAAAKLTCILNLSTEPYEGGEFEIYWEGKVKTLDSFMPGHLLVFPSFIHHRVAPIKEGTRHSLTLWLSGPAWK